jgi:putative oxidoreductase
MLKNLSQWPQVPVRIGVGICLMYDGYRFTFARGGHANFVHMLETVGLPAPEMSAWAVGLLELFGGLALLLGAFVGIVSVVLALEILMRVGVIWLEGKGFPQPLPGQPPLPNYEMNLMYEASLVALIIAGAGRFSIDRYRVLRHARDES